LTKKEEAIKMAKVVIRGMFPGAAQVVCEREQGRFEANGIEVVRVDRGDSAGMIEACKGASCLMLYGGGLTADEINKLDSSVKCILQMFIGYDAIDVKAATARGIMVANNPNYGTEEVAAMAITLFLACMRKVVIYNKQIHEQGKWSAGPENFKPYPSRRLSKLTFGVVGFGNIARHSAAFAKGLGMNVVASDPFIPQEVFDKAGVKKVELDELLAVSDGITVHVPLFDSTYHLIGKEAIAKMKDGVIIVNTARGPLVDEEALYEALVSGKVAAAGIDVLATEPIRQDHPFRGLDNIILTPHAAYHTTESIMDVENLGADLAITVCKGEVPFSCVNKRELGLVK